jgi:transcription elongation factor Elf1
MSYIEDKYIGLISVRLNKFSKKNKTYNFRCPYCGDSARHQNKTRGYLYSIKDTYNYKCHNCGQSCSFSSFLKHIDSTLYGQYVFEKFKNHSETGLTSNITQVKVKPPSPKYKYFDLPTIDTLDKSHYARFYLESRNLPEDKLKTLYFCKKFKEWTNTKKQTFKNIKYDEPRIIIPLIYQNNIFGFQGRSLNKKSNAKYISIILNEDIPKVYGLDQIDWNKNIYVLEGPFDSMFIPNSIAMVGADININSIPNYQQTDFIFVHDNEPRNKEIISRMEKIIDDGHSIVIWPSDLKHKDVNDMILSGINPVKVINSNTFRGLEAKVKLLGWKKI